MHTLHFKFSRYQVKWGFSKGFDLKNLVQIDYRVFKIRKRQIIIGHLIRFADNPELAELYETNSTAGISLTGWSGNAHVIASVTGEKYENMYSPSVRKSAPLQPR